MTSGVEYMQAMARNNAWSNFRLLNACIQLTQEEFEAARTSFSPSIKLTLNHILIVDWYYVDALEAGGRGPAVYADETPCATVTELVRAQDEVDRRLIRHCDALVPETLQVNVILARDTGDKFFERADGVLLHLFMHQIHHRGQVHAMLSGTRVEPPQLDEFYQARDIVLREAILKHLVLSNARIAEMNDSYREMPANPPIEAPHLAR